MAISNPAYAVWPGSPWKTPQTAWRNAPNPRFQQKGGSQPPLGQTLLPATDVAGDGSHAGLSPPMQHGDLLSPSPTWGVKPELQKPGSSHGDHSVTNHSCQLVVSRRPAGHVTPARLPAAFPGSPSLRYSRRAESSGRGRRQVGWDVDKLSDLCATRKQRLTSPHSNECKQGLPGRAGTWA